LRPVTSVLFLAKIIKYYLKNVPVVISALQPPSQKSYGKIVFPFLKPTLFLTQSKETEQLLTKWGAAVEYLPNGIDLYKFDQIDFTQKQKLRIKYGFDQNKYILLHVGHINEGRNLSIFTKLQSQENIQTIIVGSGNSFNFDDSAYNNLIESGCIVMRDYFEDIEEIYQLSDCYIFPTTCQEYCIESPLSILEAMACNLPVISTKFGALERLFSEGDGLLFVNSPDDFVKLIPKIFNGNNMIKTRDKVSQFSWNNVFTLLDEIYVRLGDNK
jgi:glycosyltransferase involved in cell wall biosynthesis